MLQHRELVPFILVFVVLIEEYLVLYSQRHVLRSMLLLVLKSAFL